jgi:protein phosphatase
LDELFAATRPAIPDAWREVVQRVNERVRRRGFEISPAAGIGTTLTLLHFTDTNGRIVHVGDSACFLARAGKLTQLSEDHTVEAEALRDAARGIRVELQPWAGHMLTRCLGQARLGVVDVATLGVEPGDRFLLCTDGITKVLDDDVIARLITQAASPEVAVRAIVNTVLEAGAPDNATAIAIFAPNPAA